jgi:hypothetical protein
MIISGSNIVSDAMSIRGFYITDTILIERVIDGYLAQYFCKTQYRQKEILELILSTESMPFERKRQILKVILNKHHPNIEKEYPNLFPYLVKIIEQRNIFAHYLLDTSKAALKRYPKEIGFVKFKNETSTIWYNNELLNAHLKKHIYCLDTLLIIFKIGVY